MDSDFPLFPHATRRWAKKIRGKLYYFGPWDDSNGSLQKYLDQKDDLYAGRTPRSTNDGLTLRDLLNRFLTAKKILVDAGGLTPRSFADYHATCARIADTFGFNRLVGDLASDDFERLLASMVKKWGPVTCGNEIQRVRVLFKYAHDAGLIDKPVKFGPTFRRPSKKALRKERNARKPRMFEAGQVRSMLATAVGQLRAMILLGINCAFGNTDCGELPLEALNLDTGWLEFPRPKTGIPRRCPLWPETAAALREAIDTRPNPKDKTNEGLVFITRRGFAWAKPTQANPISVEFGKLIKKLGVHRTGLGFYALRHTFETIGGEARDQVAVDHIMGRARDDMASVYRERISDERLKAVTDFVRQWLFAEKPEGSAKDNPPPPSTAEVESPPKAP